MKSLILTAIFIFVCCAQQDSTAKKQPRIVQGGDMSRTLDCQLHIACYNFFNSAISCVAIPETKAVEVCLQ